MTAPGWEAPPPAPRRSGADLAWLGATYVVLVAVGVILGLVETFLVPQRLFGGVEGLSVALALVVNGAVGSIGGVGTRTLWGAVMPGLGWLVVVGRLIFSGPGGDVVIPGKLPADPGIVWVANAFVIVGAFAIAIAMLVTARYCVAYTRQGNAPTLTA